MILMYLPPFLSQTDYLLPVVLLYNPLFFSISISWSLCMDCFNTIIHTRAQDIHVRPLRYIFAMYMLTKTVQKLISFTMVLDLSYTLSTFVWVSPAQKLRQKFELNFLVFIRSATRKNVFLSPLISQ